MNKIYKSPLAKSQIVRTIADDTGLSRRDVAAVMKSLGELIRAHVKPRSCGLFRLPGMLRISVVRKPATKARKGITEPLPPRGDHGRSREARKPQGQDLCPEGTQGHDLLKEDLAGSWLRCR